jgi:tetratricopeptide (TPR) repeat protein
MANALYALADLSRAEGNYLVARTYHEQALRTFRDIGDRRGEARALGDIGQDAAGALEDHAIVRFYYQQSLRIFQTIGDRWGEAWMLGNLARLALDQGDHVGAQSYLEQALRMPRAAGNWLQATVPISLGWTMQCVGDYPTARAYYDQGLAIARANNILSSMSYVYDNLGTLARNQGEPAEARSWYEQGVGSARASGEQLQEAIGLWGLGNVALDTGQLDAAVEAYGAAISVFERLDQTTRAIEAVAGLAAVALARSDIAQGLAHAETILAYLAHGSLTPGNTEEPLRVELICYQVLRAAHDPRTPAVLERAHSRLQERATNINDEAMRRMFLHNVPYHRAIVAMWAEAQS